MFVYPLTKVAVNEVTTCVYVGTSVGDFVGALVGEAEGWGVGTAATENVKDTPVVLVVVMVSLSVMVPDPWSLLTTYTDEPVSATPVPVTVEPTTTDVVSNEYTFFDPDVKVHLMVVVLLDT